ncbi:hypothetical protein [Bradyrhizobium retamae]|uniref:Uncharacterized protein n=1 Tax=Bradyrhizobium retamae TaxID=1300035 RepID=A0A0R3MWL7_9BRAD|nr:hypothetical protein [Bradyrhizobium retamae]KRR22285.1 hypothetical protein CQ13_29810 [Bradyrhizobium retamae]
MKLLGIAIATILIPIGAAILAYQVAYPSVTLRYRLTLEVEVDGQPKFGSGVIEVTYSKQPQIAAQHELAIGCRGEAVVLDLGSRGTLFALLREDTDSRSGPEWIVLRAFNFPGGSLPSPVEEGIKQVQHVSGKRELPLDSLPMLVRFRDINDPKTVERVHPQNLVERFGPGARLVRATLEIVPPSDPLTTGIEKRLGWLPQYNDRMLDGRSIETISSELRFANSLSTRAFKRRS